MSRTGLEGAPSETHPDARVVHELKCWPAYFVDVVRGVKTFEVRRDDREPMFQPGHLLLLREWDDRNGYSGRECERLVTYVLPGGEFGIEDGYVVMGIAARLGRSRPERTSESGEARR